MKIIDKMVEVKGLVLNKKLISAIVVIVTVLLVTGSVLHFYPQQPNQPKAAIIDQLSSSQLTSSSRYVNQTFIDAATSLLYTRFPRVDYYSDNATVDNYRNLPSMGYKLVIWRAHTALDNQSKFVAISTSERYGSKDYEQYSSGQLTLCQIKGDQVMYFAITPKFIEETMSGEFEDTVIILMTCNGLKTDYFKTAEAFVQRGAKVLTSWDSWISSSDSDYATTLLLQYLISENNTISEAVGKIPSYPSVWGPAKLDFYPKNNPEIAEYTIPNYKQNDSAYNTGPALIAILEKDFKLWVLQERVH